MIAILHSFSILLHKSAFRKGESFRPLLPDILERPYFRPQGVHSRNHPRLLVHHLFLLSVVSLHTGL